MHVSRRPFRIALLRTGRVQADGRQECILKMLFQKRRGMRELMSSRMCLASERVDALEVEIAALGEVEEQGGMARAIETGLPKQRIEEAAARKQARIDRGEYQPDSANLAQKMLNLE